MKLELGCGQRPTPGYLHNDVNPFDDVELVGDAWAVSLPDGSLSEVIALGMVEHLSYANVSALFRNVHRMLEPGGVFLFDVPDIPVWCRYVVDHFAGRMIPFDIDHVFATIYGWQRWPGDEHRSGWHRERVAAELRAAGFTMIGTCSTADAFLSRGLERRRMSRPSDAHIYCEATK